MFLLNNFTVRFLFNHLFKSIFMNGQAIYPIIISYLARALSLGLRFTANMTDYIILIIFILILYLVVFSFALLCLFFICLGNPSISDSVISLSFFPVFINRKDNNS